MFKRTVKNARRFKWFAGAMLIYSTLQLLLMAYWGSRDIINPTTAQAVILSIVVVGLCGFWFAVWNTAVEIEYDIAAEERERAKK